MGFEVDIQTGVYEALTGDSSLVSAVVGVYDNVLQPNNAAAASDFPYITIGEDVLTEWDTDTETGADVTITIHTWSRKPGRKEVKEIQAIIYNILHRGVITVNNYHLVGIDWIESQSILDSDGHTRHGIQTFRITLDQL